MKLRHTFITLFACGALALAVGACTHSGDDGIPQSDLDAAEQARMEAEQAAKEAEEAKEQAEQEKAEAEAEAEAERERADELAAEDAREQAKMDLAAAKALFAALRHPRAILGDPAIGAVTTGSRTGTTGEPDGQVDPPALEDAMKDGNYSGKMGTMEYSAVVMTTKEAASSRLFAQHYSGPAFISGIYTFPTGAARTSEGIESSNFPQESGTRIYGAGKREFSGTLDGAAGTYACSGAVGECTAKFTDGGTQLSDTGTWTFTPADGARVKIEDIGYQSYGWWLRKDEDGTVDAGPVHFTTGGTGFAASGVTALQGSATYEGSAAGKYAIYSGAFSERSEAGHFTADAMLMANFGDGNQQGRVSGMIDNFMTEAGAKDDWMVSLEESDAAGDLSNGLGDTGAFSGNTVWTIGSVSSDGAGDMGMYSGNLYDSQRPGGDGVPHEVGGTFDAKFEAGVGEMVGAFAATRETQ